MNEVHEAKKDFGLGGVAIVLAILAVLMVLVFPSWGNSRAAERAVSNNVRKLAAAAEQYYLEYNTASVALEDLVGPNHYVKVLQPFGNETYPTEFERDAPIVVSNLPRGRSLTFEVDRSSGPPMPRLIR